MWVVVGQSGQLAQSLAARTDLAKAEFMGRTQLDLANPEHAAARLRELQPSIVINAAAWTAVDQAEKDLDQARVLNADAPAALARVCRELDIPFVHVSTDYVFSGEHGPAWKEEDPIAPVNAYGQTKAEGEAAVMSVGGRIAILRTSWVFSPFGNNFVKTMARLGKERDEVRVVADQVGRPTFAPDLAEACVQMATLLRMRPELAGIYHYANSGHVSWADVAQATFDELTRQGMKSARMVPIPTSDYPTPAKRPAWSTLDTTKIEALGIETPDWRGRIRVCF
jgi:dTDP-4-dehydrorhamnose reductase